MKTQANRYRSRQISLRSIQFTGTALVALQLAFVSPADAQSNSTQSGPCVEAADRAFAIRVGATDNLQICTGSNQVSSKMNLSDDRRVEVGVDSHSIAPVLSAGLIASERAAVRSEPIKFVAYSNYPTFISKGEIRIFVAGAAADSEPLAIIPVNPDGMATWTAPETAPEQLYFVYRVSNDAGRFDETVAAELVLLDQVVKIEGAPTVRPVIGEVDKARIRNISLANAVMITVRGIADNKTETVRVSGQRVPIDDIGAFATRQIVLSGEQSVKIVIEREGIPTFTTTRRADAPRSDWFVAGQADITFQSSNGNGPAIAVSGDALADGDHLTSRAAFYAKGRFGDGWKLTGSIDTGETLLKDVFSNLDRKDPRQLLRRLNSNEYYTTYGDDSTLVEDAPTQGSFYLKVEKDDSHLLIGNFVANINQAELAQLDRGLFGAIIDHKSSSVTSFGERKLQLTAFASDPGTIPGRDEFRGTGGSLYYLKRQDISIGSERVRIEIRDRDTGLVVETKELRPQEDYDVDYFQGRVTLTSPLSSYATDNTLVRQGSGSGNIPILVVRYEYSPAVGALDGYTIGGRGAAWIGDILRLGVTAQRETTDSADQELLGADMLMRLHAGTYFKSEIAQTSGPAFGQSNSVDGGLSFREVTSTGITSRNSQAYRFEGAVDVAELAGKTGDQGKLSAFYEHFDAGFSANSHLTLGDTNRWGARVAVPIGEKTKISGEYENLSAADAGTRRSASGEIRQQFGNSLNARLGLRYDNQTAGNGLNSVNNGERTDAAFELEYKPDNQNWSAQAFAQKTIDADLQMPQNDRAGFGVKAEISDRLSLSGEVSGGDGGLGADIQLNRRIGDGTEAYLGYSLLADRTDTGFSPVNLFSRSNRGALTVGARHRFSSALSIYGENRVGHGGNPPSVNRSFGLKFDPDEHVSISGSFENGRIEDATAGFIRRTAATIGFGYANKSIQAGTNLEYRSDNGQGRQQKAWLVRNSVAAQIGTDWRALGRLNFAIANDDGASLRAADYVEGMIGFAYRPVLNDRLNLLGHYTYFQDFGPIGQITAGGETASPKQRSQILSLDANFELTKKLTIGAKYAFREGKVSLSRSSDQYVSSRTQLGIVRVDYRVVREWDLLGEVRYLSNDIAGDSRWGALAAIYRHVGNNAKIGVGYSFSDFSDDLTDQSYNSRGVFVNLLGQF